ncbi:prepilin-type N-terminal cleavage/methylation domain-containing protein [uncultured Aquabacterium sp.]|uniref:type IV pilus modification PilV family protein n=2 Tax=Pseudomonadota TaxID=1224 RepID=UPI0025D361AF|nr:prepilin-type N-terminal cleavage/methylation domain-containing protein [uncultured Aquabacterium sp.]
MTRPAVPRLTRRMQRGILLIEVLVSAVIFAIGVLALIGLQGRMNKAQAEARDRADAAYLASELQARMWGDLRNLAEYNGCPTTYATCQEWRNKLAAVLPGSAGQTQSVTVSGNLVSIVLRWKTANGETRNYSTQTTIVAAQ